jgi:hypothetical protein
LEAEAGQVHQLPRHAHARLLQRSRSYRWHKLDSHGWILAYAFSRELLLGLLMASNPKPEAPHPKS